ncbi:hypothetical protein NDU88_001127 [Pleurodeles waltl]|uniref:Uncharacterized protein n=1 Tax=Pleurodeles waltl TaxID=8319 RepID=A0AAV7VVJ7_PLEWA|nr:hypothetical protein NDU88_001127 [Pleurodeles waltl]
MPRRTEAQMEELEGEASLDDLVEALGGMASGKAPGPDRLPVEFYQTYFGVILLRLLEILHEARSCLVFADNKVGDFGFLLILFTSGRTAIGDIPNVNSRSQASSVMTSRFRNLGHSSKVTLHFTPLGPLI